MYECDSWTMKKAEHQKTDAFELWCWRRLLRVPWTLRRSNQSILKEISPGCSLEGLMLKLKLQYFGHLMRRVDSLEKTLILGERKSIHHIFRIETLLLHRFHSWSCNRVLYKGMCSWKRKMWYCNRKKRRKRKQKVILKFHVSPEGKDQLNMWAEDILDFTWVEGFWALICPGSSQSWISSQGVFS